MRGERKGDRRKGEEGRLLATCMITNIGSFLSFYLFFFSPASFVTLV